MDEKHFAPYFFVKRIFAYVGTAILVLQPLAFTRASTPTVTLPLAIEKDNNRATVTIPPPREETLYYNGLQWGAVTCWNPYSTNCNNQMAIAQQDNARVTMFETPYMYNMLTGESVPLLADGPWAWNEDQTILTFHIKPAAHWSNGIPVVAYDVVYTWYANRTYETNMGLAYEPYIATIAAPDTHTVQVYANTDMSGNPINPQMVQAYLNNAYVVQANWTLALETRVDHDGDAFKNDLAEDVVYSGPYHKYYADDSIVVLVRNDSYWGQDESMWGELPRPKYLAHVIYADNDAGTAALLNNEVDVSQQFNIDAQDWIHSLPISTYMGTAPYGIGASLPTAFYNLNEPALNVPALRKAIGMAVDYDTIVADSMGNQSATFEQVPRSLMSPSPWEQSLYDHDAVADLQWAGNDISGANALLDAAGIVDTNDDGNREYEGEELHFVATCPNGWADWMAAIDKVAEAGQAIGIDITTNFPDWDPDYITAVTNWPPPEGYDIFMWWTDGAGIAEPWSRIHHLIGPDYAFTSGNWVGNLGGYYSTRVGELLDEIPTLTDPEAIKADYTELVQIYLTDVPSFTLMYRPQNFHTVNETYWTNYPRYGDGQDIPPLDWTDGYSIAGLYKITNVLGSGELPRDETLYYNGLQWGAVTCWNPYSTSCNNQMAIAQQDNARVTMFETPYMYNMLTGELVPLLAEGPWTWNEDRTELTFDINPAAHWSDGTPVTAEDVEYTWTTRNNYDASGKWPFVDYIDSFVAVDADTVQVNAKLTETDDPINPLMVESFLTYDYILQKAWTQKLEARNDGNADALRADYAGDVVGSGPYKRGYADGTKVVLVRDDNYWGQDESMWGGLPAPKYLAHVIYADNAAGDVAFKAGDVDVSQQFIANVQDLWEVQHLPVSTYLEEAPYGIGASLPTAFYNLNVPALQNVTIRKAIAMAVDYDTIVAEAMTNQSATFEQVPRSLMNPSPSEQVLYDHEAVASLQWAGNDLVGAETLLDEAGIIDTNHDGNREYEGEELHLVATAPNGWTDWQAAIEVLAASGHKIGIDITANYPEWSDYQVAVTNWPPPEGYDIFMMWSDGAGPTQPWSRIDHLIGSEYAHMSGNWSGNWGGYANPEVDGLLGEIPGLTDPEAIKADYTELVQIYLTDVPSFTLMYRPQSFHTVNATVWSGFPHDGDGLDIPPLDWTDGYSIAGLYHLSLTPPVTWHYIYLPLIRK